MSNSFNYWIHKYQSVKVYGLMNNPPSVRQELKNVYLSWIHFFRRSLRRGFESHSSKLKRKL